MIQTYRPAGEFVDAIQITEDNVDEVLAWCGGRDGRIIPEGAIAVEGGVVLESVDALGEPVDTGAIAIGEPVDAAAISEAVDVSDPVAIIDGEPVKLSEFLQPVFVETHAILIDQPGRVDQADVGDWIVLTSSGFAPYTDANFTDNYVLV